MADIGLGLRFIAVADDSRCPTQVQCVWAGDALVLIESARAAGDARLDTLHTNLDPRAVVLGRVELRLVRLDPYPETPGPIPPGQYVVTLATRSVP